MVLRYAFRLDTIQIGLKLSVIVRETGRLTTFYPLALLLQPNPACALRQGDLNSNKPHLLWSVAYCNQVGLRACSLQLVLPDLTLHCLCCFYAVFILAPSGITPSFKYRHKQMTSLRATAMIAIRLPRLLGPPTSVRLTNQRANALSGW